MTALAAAAYLSGLPVEHFNDGLENFYSVASQSLESLDSLNSSRPSSNCSSYMSYASTKSSYPSSVYSDSSVDSGFGGSRRFRRPVFTKSSPLLDLETLFAKLEKKILEDAAQALRDRHTRLRTKKFLDVIDDLERRYYLREEEKNAEVQKSTLSVSKDTKITYQGRNILNLFENISTDWKPTFAQTSLPQEPLNVDMIQYADDLNYDNSDNISLGYFTQSNILQEPYFNEL